MKNFTKKLVTNIFLFLFSFISTNADMNIVYKVNNEIITSYDIENELNYFLNTVLNPFYNTNGIFLRAMLVKLLGNSTIDPHIDLGQNMNVTNRIHFPIRTNDNCFFISGETMKNLKQFEIWELNNSQKEHSVVNRSSEERIHLIVDYLPIKTFEEYSKYEYL